MLLPNPPRQEDADASRLVRQRPVPVPPDIAEVLSHFQRLVRGLGGTVSTPAHPSKQENVRVQHSEDLLQPASFYGAATVVGYRVHACGNTGKPRHDQREVDSTARGRQLSSATVSALPTTRHAARALIRCVCTAPFEVNGAVLPALIIYDRQDIGPSAMIYDHVS